MLDGKVVRALVNTGCSTAVVRSQLVNNCEGESCSGTSFTERGEESLSSIEGVKCPTYQNVSLVCGKLVGHYPIAGWLRVACSYIKSRAKGTRWDDYVGEHTVTMMREVLE